MSAYYFSKFHPERFQQHSGDNDAMQADLDKRTEEQLDTIRKQFNENRQSVVDKLLARVLEVRKARYLGL